MHWSGGFAPPFGRQTKTSGGLEGEKDGNR